MRIPLALVLTAALLAGCSQPSDTPLPTTTTTVSDVPETTAPPVTAPGAEAVDWSDPSIVVEFEAGRTVRACDGGAPLLCVELDGVPVGTVEALAFPADSFEEFDPAATTEENLRALATSFIEAMAIDRQAGCGDGYLLEAMEPSPFPLAGNGITYGFVGTMEDGAPSERNLQYATIIDGSVIMIVAAAYDEGGCPGRDDTSGFDSATLNEFEPFLEIVLADSPLPDLVGS